jgi:hypothetical protein
MIKVSAAIEQISSGQIGHPAACIIESNRALSLGRSGDRHDSAARGLWRGGGVRRRRHVWVFAMTRPGASKYGRKVVHRTRGQLCGQPWLRGPWRQHRRRQDRIAELLSRIKLFVFKYLHRRSAALRPVLPRQPSIGAAVELSARAGHGFADE